MPKLGLSIKIDVTKIDKSRLFKGEKGTYLNLTTIIDTENQDQYGNNGFISQETSREERQNGVKTPILGNTKVFWSDSGQSHPHQSSASQQAPDDDFDDDIPF